MSARKPETIAEAVEDLQLAWAEFVLAFPEPWRTAIFREGPRQLNRWLTIWGACWVAGVLLVAAWKLAT